MVAIWSPMTASSDQWTPFTFHVDPGACPVAPGGLDGSGTIRILEFDNGHGNVHFTIDATGAASSPDSQHWIFGDHDSGRPSEAAPTFLTEKFHLIGQGSAPNVTLQLLLKIQPDGTVQIDKERGLQFLGCANLPG